MFDEEISYEGTIHQDFKKKSMVKAFLGSCIFPLIIILLFSFMFMSIGNYIASDVIFNIIILMLIVYATILFLVILFSNIYYKAYIRHYSFQIMESHIVIKHGVFRQAKATIPFSRIQNISVTSGILDRWCKIFTINIETAGGSGFGYRSGGNVRGAEGCIPGQKEPGKIEAKIKEMIKKTLNTPQGPI